MPKISALDLLAAPAPADYLPIVDADAGTTKRVLLSSLGSIISPFTMLSDYDDLADAITTIAANTVTLFMNEAVVMDESVTVPSNVVLFFINGITITTTGFTLEIYSPSHIIASPSQQIFSGSGTVSFTVGGDPGFGWAGFNASGTAASNSTALQAILTSIDNVGGTVKIGEGTFQLNSIIIPQLVNLVGSGVDVTVLDGRGASDTIYNTEYWWHQRIADMTITHENNVTGASINIIDAKLGANSCIFENLYLYGKSGGVTANGLVIRGVDPGTSTANSNQFNNNFSNVRTLSDSEVTGIALYLYGQDVANARCNANNITKCVLDGFTTGFYVNGNGNTITNTTFNGPCTGGAALHFYGDGTVGNILLNPYIDSGVTGDKVRLESTAVGYHMVTIIEPVTELLPSQIIDDSAGANFARFTLLSRGHLSMPRQFIAGETDPSSLATISGLFGARSDDLFHVVADPTATSGHLILSGSAFAGGVNAVSNNGGVSAAIADDASAQWRVVKTSDGGTFVILSYTDKDGVTKTLKQFRVSDSTDVSAINPQGGLLVGFAGTDADGSVHFLADNSANTARIILSAPSYAQTYNAISKDGGVSAIFNDDADAQFRVAKVSSNGNTFTKLLSVSSSGALKDLQTSNGPVGTLTLTASAASTTVNNTAVTANSLIFLFPTSANAAADIAAGNVYISAKVAATSFTITHPNNANADKTFNYLILN